MTVWRILWLLLLASVLGVGAVQAQDDTEYRMEVGGGLGTMFYLGDVNETLYENAGFDMGATLRFLVNPRMSLKVELLRGSIKGNTASVKPIFPTDPNSGAVSTQPLVYAFTDRLTAADVMYELHFWGYGYERGYQNLSRLTPYLQFGLGAVYAQESKAFTIGVPMGLGLKYKVGKRLNLGLDWRVHFTLSDNLDGLDSPYGVKGAGFKNKDHYISTMLTLTYDISPRCVTCNKDKR